MNVIVAIATCERPFNYAVRTISSASMEDPHGWQSAIARIAFVDGPSASYLSGASIEAMDFVTHDGARLGAYGNILRCLQRSHELCETADVLLLEDDMVFAPQWLTSLEALVERHIRPYKPNFALSGYVPYSLKPMFERVPCGWYTTPFYASCCLWFSNTILDECIEFLDKGGHKPMDLTLADYFKLQDVSLFGTTRSVADHIGEHSTLGCLGLRKAVDFGTIQVP